MTTKKVRAPEVATSLRVSLPSSMSLRDPEGSELGRRIVAASIQLLDSIGFEEFTFRKLGGEIGSPEASVYRYFSDKAMLVRYLEAWYWTWLDFRFRQRSRTLIDSRQRLDAALLVLAESGSYDPTFFHIDEAALHRVVVREARKAYGLEKARGAKKTKKLPPMSIFHESLAQVIAEYSPGYKYPRALALGIITSLHAYMFFGANSPLALEIDPQEEVTSVLEFLRGLTSVLSSTPSVRGTKR